MIEKNGGKNVGSISSKTSFILAGENMGPAKLEKAQKLGVKIMSEDEFLARYGEDWEVRWFYLGEDIIYFYNEMGWNFNNRTPVIRPHRLIVSYS